MVASRQRAWPTDRVESQSTIVISRDLTVEMTDEMKNRLVRERATWYMSGYVWDDVIK